MRCRKCKKEFQDTCTYCGSTNVEITDWKKAHAILFLMTGLIFWSVIISSIIAISIQIIYDYNIK